jgi:hypothetical protein
MKKIILTTFLLFPFVGTAQEDPVKQLQQQLLQLQSDFKKQQELYGAQIEHLQKKISELEKNTVSITTEPSTPNTPESLAMSRPTDPIRVRRYNSFLDIGLIGTFAAGTSTAKDIEGGLQLGGHDPNQRGFTVQGIEAAFSGAVDPYFRGNANLIFSIDSEGESFVELEEAWLETMSLPGNFQIRGGQFFSEFGRENTLHPHARAFVDSSLANARLLGPEGLRNPGMRLSWLAPTPFYSEIFLGVQNSSGATASSFRGAGNHGHGGAEEEAGLPFAFRHLENDRGIRNWDDLLFTPRYAVSWDLTPNQTVLVGSSAAFGPNNSGEAGQETRTEIYGVDLTWKWKPPGQSGGFPFVAWQTEGIWRRFKAGDFDWDENANGLVDDGELDGNGDGVPDAYSSERLNDYGFYSQLTYGFRKGWVAGLRYDWVTSNKGDYESISGRDESRAERWRISPNLTWLPTEFSKIRLQYNYDDRAFRGTDHSIWLQFEFILGAHGAHKF